MSTASTTYDVFVSATQADRRVADLIRRSFEDRGLRVFSEHDVLPGSDWEEILRSAMAESRVLVAVLSRSALNSPWFSMEIGAALAWGKAIYIVLSGVTTAEVPASLARHRVVTAREVPEIVEEFCQNIAPLTEDQVRQLGDLYSSLRIPTDQLAARPAALDSLTRDFNRRESLTLSPERVLQELIRLRKKGQLPKLRRQTG